MFDVNIPDDDFKIDWLRCGAAVGLIALIGISSGYTWISGYQFISCPAIRENMTQCYNDAIQNFRLPLSESEELHYSQLSIQAWADCTRNNPCALLSQSEILLRGIGTIALSILSIKTIQYLS